MVFSMGLATGKGRGRAKALVVVGAKRTVSAVVTRIGIDWIERRIVSSIRQVGFDF